MTQVLAVVMALVPLPAGSAPRVPDPMVAQVLQVEREARELLGRLKGEPLARRCVAPHARRAAALVRQVRAARRSTEPWRGSVAVTRAYVQAVILRQQLAQCRELVGLRVGPSRTRVTLQIDRTVVPAWP